MTSYNFPNGVITITKSIFTHHKNHETLLIVSFTATGIKHVALWSHIEGKIQMAAHLPFD